MNKLEECKKELQKSVEFMYYDKERGALGYIEWCGKWSDWLIEQTEKFRFAESDYVINEVLLKEAHIRIKELETKVEVWETRARNCNFCRTDYFTNSI